MKRRRFLQALGAIAVTGAAPLPSSPAAADSLFLDTLANLVRGISPIRVDDVYWIAMHPKQEHDLRCMAARERWYEAWSRFRRARRHGAAPGSWTPRQILEWFGDGPQWEQGTIEGMRLARENNLRINKILGL